MNRAAVLTPDCERDAFDLSKNLYVVRVALLFLFWYI